MVELELSEKEKKLIEELRKLPHSKIMIITHEHGEPDSIVEIRKSTKL